MIEDVREITKIGQAVKPVVEKSFIVQPGGALKSTKLNLHVNKVVPSTVPLPGKVGVMEKPAVISKPIGITTQEQSKLQDQGQNPSVEDSQTEGKVYDNSGLEPMPLPDTINKGIDDATDYPKKA